MEKKIILTMKDLASLTSWKKVKEAIKYYYPEDKSDYEDVFQRICMAPKVRVKKGESIRVKGGMYLDWEWFKEHGKKFLEDVKTGEEEIYYGIDITKEGDDTPWSMSFQKWDYLINLPISVDTLTHYTPKDILAHFIWEITYYGNEKQMEKTGKEVWGSARKSWKAITKKLKET